MSIQSSNNLFIFQLSLSSNQSKMKINDAIAAAILAYCVVAAPTSLNSTAENSAALPSEPILQMISPSGLLQPVSPKKQNATRSEIGNLEDFPTIIEDHHGNEDEEPRPPFRPFGRGGHGPVVNPKHHPQNKTSKTWFHPATGGPLHHNHHNITLIPVNVTHPTPLKDIDETPASDVGEIKVSYRSTSNDSGTCSAKANAKRSIGHEHDQEHTIIDECDTYTKEENSKTGDTITSHGRVHVGTVHSDRVGESHRNFNDGVNKIDGVEGLNDLPPQLQENYLDELAKLNTTKMNYDINEKHNNSTLTTDTKSNPNDGSSSSETDLHTINISSHRVHDEVKVDTKPAASVDNTQDKKATQSSSLPLPASSSISSVETSAHVEPTPTSQSSKVDSTSTPSTVYSTSTSTPTPVALLIESLFHLLATRTHSIARPSSTFASSSVIESKSESKPSMVPASSSFIESNIQSKSTPTPTATTTTTITSTTKVSVPTMTKNKPRLKTKATSSSSSSSKPTPTSAGPVDDEDIPVPESEMKGPDGEELEPIRSQRRGDQRAYLANVQKLNTKHMNEVQVCKSNITCIAASNREFATALADLDYAMS